MTIHQLRLLLRDDIILRGGGGVDTSFLLLLLFSRASVSYVYVYIIECCCFVCVCFSLALVLLLSLFFSEGYIIHRDVMWCGAERGKETNFLPPSVFFFFFFSLTQGGVDCQLLLGSAVIDMGTKEWRKRGRGRVNKTSSEYRVLHHSKQVPTLI